MKKRGVVVWLFGERSHLDLTLAQADVMSSTCSNFIGQISLPGLIGVAAPSKIVRGLEAAHVPRTRRNAGFSLVEVIVALAVLSATIGVLLNVIGNALHHARYAERAAEAAALAQSLLAEVGTQRRIMAGESDGEFANGYRWRLSMQTFRENAERHRWPVAAYTVIAEVSWSDGARDQTFRLTTLRIGPQEAGN